MTTKNKKTLFASLAGILILLVIGGIGCSILPTAMQSKIDRVEFDANEKMSECGDTRLHYSVGTDYWRTGLRGLEPVKLLVSKGADVHAKNSRGWTPLRAAVSTARQYQDIEIVRFLVSSGADVNTRCERGITPLHIAVIMENRELIELLVFKGADVNTEDTGGLTPLHWAVAGLYAVDRPEVRYPNVEIAKFLVSAGADVNARNNDGKTPLDTARENGHTVAVEFLTSIR